MNRTVSPATVPGDQVNDCAGLIPWKAWFNDPEAQWVWGAVGGSASRLRQACRELGESDPAKLKAFSDEWRAIQRYLEAASKAPASTAPKSVPAPPPAASPIPNSNCNANYSGCVPNASDVDCAGGSGNGPAYIRGPVSVLGSDVYGLDRDNDGVGCE